MSASSSAQLMMNADRRGPVEARGCQPFAASTTTGKPLMNRAAVTTNSAASSHISWSASGFFADALSRSSRRLVARGSVKSVMSTSTSPTGLAKGSHQLHDGHDTRYPADGTAALAAVGRPRGPRPASQRALRCLAERHPWLVTMLAAAHRSPGLPRDAQDDQRDGQADERVGDGQADGHNGGGGDDCQRDVRVGAGVMAVGDQG